MKPGRIGKGLLSFAKGFGLNAEGEGSPVGHCSSKGVVWFVCLAERPFSL